MLVTKIGLGTVQFGVPYGISNKSGQTPLEEVTKIMDSCKKYGIRYIDTATAYGAAEKLLGNTDLKDYRVVSKYLPVEHGNTIEAQLTKSLNRLNIPALYGYLAHRPQDLLEHLEQWDELKSLQSSGKIEKIGFSLNRVHELEDLLSKGLQPDLIQVPFNYFDNRFEKLMVELRNSGCEIHTRSTFLQGLFFVPVTELPDFFSPVKPVLTSLQEQYKDRLSGILLKYVMEKPFIDVVIIGVNNAKQLVDNLSGSTIAETVDENMQTVDEQILMPSCWPKK